MMMMIELKQNFILSMRIGQDQTKKKKKTVLVHRNDRKKKKKKKRL